MTRLIHDNPWLLAELLKAAQAETATPPAQPTAPSHEQLVASLKAVIDSLKSKMSGDTTADIGSQNMESMGDFVEWLATHPPTGGAQIAYRADQQKDRPSENYGYYKLEPGTKILVAQDPKVRPTLPDRSDVGYWINVDALKKRLVAMQADPKLRNNVTYQVQLLNLIRFANEQLDMGLSEQYQDVPGDGEVVDNVPNPIDPANWGAVGQEKLTYGDVKSGNALGGWIKSKNIGVKKDNNVYHITDLQYFKICDVISVLAARANAMTATDAATQKLVGAYQAATANLSKQYNCPALGGGGDQGGGGGAAPGSQAFLEQLVTVLPFDPNTIDFDKITTFTDMYASWVGNKKPNVAQLKDRVHRAITNANALLSVPSPIQIGGVATEAFKAKAKDPYYAKKLAIALADVIQSAGSLYQDFANTFEQSYGKAAAQTLQQQVFPGGPQYNNMQILNRLIGSLPG